MTCTRGGIPWLRVSYYWRVNNQALARPAKVWVIFTDPAGNYRRKADGSPEFHNIHPLAYGAGLGTKDLPRLLRETFDIYVVRAAPHHFSDLDGFLAEAFRVLKPGRDAALIDCAPPLPARDVLHAVELRRDPSHILSLTVDEWVVRIERAGFEVEMAQARELDWNYEEWMANQAVPPEVAAKLAMIIESAQGEARVQLHPERREGKLWHAYWHALIRAHKPSS